MRRILILAVCAVGSALAAFVMSSNNAWAAKLNLPPFLHTPTGEVETPHVKAPHMPGGSGGSGASRRGQQCGPPGNASQLPTCQ